MQTAPTGLSEAALVSVLGREWAVTVASIGYRPVGFGSHHWEAVDASGARWFVTGDDLETKRHSLREPLDTAFERLRAALSAACALHQSGCTFVVAPVRTRDGAPLARTNDRFGVALYPFVDGESYAFAEFSSTEHRLATLGLVVAIHAAPTAVRRRAPVDDFTIPHRDDLEATLGPAAAVEERGPYARPTADLLAGNVASVRRLLARYDQLVRESRSDAARIVLTHGEPHPGNTMATSDGWRLIDWDTALAAPPERDLWSLEPGDGSILGAYRDATGVTPLPSMLELYRIRWDLADIAAYVSRFRGHHTGGSDDDASWEVLRRLVARA